MWREDRFTGAVDPTPDEQTAYTFDDLGRRNSTTEYANLDADPELEQSRVETFGFDPITGAEIVTTTPEGVVRHAYDPATGRLTATWTGNAADVAAAQSSAYTLTEYEYNYLGQLWKVKAMRLNGATPSTSQVTTYMYDAVGNLDTTTLPNGVVEDYNYDGLNRLDTLTAKRGATTVFSQDYDVRADGQRTGVSETREGGATVRIDWTYDALNRLTSETFDSSDNAKDYTATYSFDLSGNRVKKVQTGFEAATTDSVYNDRDQLIAADSTVNANDATYVYDANGSQTSVAHNGQTDTYGYDLRNKMVSVTKGGVASTYTYDGAGNRVAETSGGATTYYLTDANNPTGYDQPIEEKSNPTGSPIRSYVLGQSVLGQSNATSGTVYFLTDGHGSTRGLIDSTGSVTSSFEYDAFGGAIGFNPAGAATPFLFGGDAIYDPASGLYLHGNGVRGRDGFRFIQADELGNGRNGEPISLHKYLYANGTPILMVDPSGHEGLIAQLGNIGIRGIVTGILVRGVIGAGLGGVIGGATSAYLHVLTHESFDGIGTAFWDGAKSGAIWGAIIGASSINPQLLAATLSGALGYSTGQTILALTDAQLPARTKVAVVALLLLQGTLARASIQRGVTAATDPNYTANANARGAYLDERAQIAKLTQELGRGGQNAEGIARAVVDFRNAMKIRARALMSDGDRAALEGRNQQLYGDRIGPTYEQLLAKYGSPEGVIEASMRTNAQLDAMYGPTHFTIPFPPLEDVDQ